MRNATTAAGFLRPGILAICVLLASMAGQAQSASAWDLVHPTRFDWQSRAQRHAIAGDLIARVGLLAGVVPAQTDEQAQQLKEAAAALEGLGDEATPRQRSKLYLSRSYQHRRLLDLLADTLSALHCVQNEKDINKEMHCWAMASVLLMDEETVDIALSVLRSARMIPRDEDMPVKAQDPKIWYGEYGRGIVRHIITPYLQTLAHPATEPGPAAQVDKDA